MFFETIAKFDTFQFICGTPNIHLMEINYFISIFTYTWFSPKYWISTIFCFAGAAINLVCIMIINYLYEYVAQWLTELELNRTQSEYDDSLSLKIYVLQFVNYYASIIYVAFFKGKFRLILDISKNS